jgi:hypothetical protein
MENEKICPMMSTSNGGTWCCEKDKSRAGKDGTGMNACKYCNCGHGNWHTLFRIVESYPCGDEIDFTDEDEDCDIAPYQPYNRLNLTIGVVGDAIMFEDKRKPFEGFGEVKRYLKIKYCPMCGRELTALARQEGENQCLIVPGS